MNLINNLKRHKECLGYMGSLKIYLLSDQFEKGGKMKEKRDFRYGVACFTLLLLMVPQICSAADMEIIKDNMQIQTDRRHSWNPWVEYNSVDDEFFLIWRTSGILREDCGTGDDYECTKSFQSIDAARISSDGEILGTPIISPAEGPLNDVSWKMMPRIAYNKFRKEYLVSFYEYHQIRVSSAMIVTLIPGSRTLPMWASVLYVIPVIIRGSVI